MSFFLILIFRIHGAWIGLGKAVEEPEVYQFRGRLGMLLGADWADAGCLSSFVISPPSSFSVWLLPLKATYLISSVGGPLQGV